MGNRLELYLPIITRTGVDKNHFSSVIAAFRKSYFKLCDDTIHFIIVPLIRSILFVYYYHAQHNNISTGYFSETNKG